MGFEIFKESYAGGIKQISIGSGDKAITVGGETCYPFYQFEGDMPNKPKIAMEIWDMEPEDWPDAALTPFKDVVSDPAAWAKKCVDEYGAEMIVIQLKSTDPNGNDAAPEAAVATIKKVAGAVGVPLIIWGCANAEKDEAVFKKVAEDCQDLNLTLGPVEDKNHKGIGAAAMGYGHSVISSSPIDVNLAKQVNILLENLGLPMDRLIIDPTTGGLGYGMEYSYSVMERLRMAGMTQGDDKLQFPLINNLGNEVWKCKEAKQTVEEAPTLGDPETRGIMMEAVGAVTYLMAGSNILMMRHPEAIRLIKAFIDAAVDGGSVADVAGVAKLLGASEIDYVKLAPKPDLKIEEEPKKAAPKKAAAKKAAPKAAAAAPAAAAPKKEATQCPLKRPPAQFDKRANQAAAAPAAAAPAAAVAATAAVALDTTALKEEIRDIIRAELKGLAASEAKAKVKDAKKPTADDKAKAEVQAQAKAEAEAFAKREAEAEELRQQRAKAKEEREAKRMAAKEVPAAKMTPASKQKSNTEKILEGLNRLHKRAAA